MKTQISEKGAEAGQNLKRPKTTKGENSVNGHAVFENGKLTKKEFAKKILDDEKGLLEVANQIAKPKKKKQESIPDEEDPKWEEYITLNNCKSQAKREEIKKMIETALALPNISWSRVGGDFVAKTNNRIILRICAMTRPPTFSAMCPTLGPSISRYKLEEFIEAIPKAHAMFHRSKSGTAKKVETPQNSLSGKDAVAILKAKVEGLSKTSKGFVVPKEVRVTDPSVKAWIKENCYSAVADKIMLNRVP